MLSIQSNLNEVIKNMEDSDLFIRLSTKSHVLLFLTDSKEIEVVTSEINIIKHEIKNRGAQIGVSLENEKRRY